jgi:hypothetical protein
MLRTAYLQQESCSLTVVLLGGNVKRWQAHFAASVVFEEYSDHLVVALLHRHSQWRESVL